MSFRIAERQAMRSVFKQHRLGAVIVKGGRVLSTGFNSRRPSRLLSRPTLHAEASAVLKLLKQRRLSDLSGADLYVTRFTAGGRVGMARPCPSCMDLIRAVGIRRVYYSTDTEVTAMEKIN